MRGEEGFVLAERSADDAIGQAIGGRVDDGREPLVPAENVRGGDLGETFVTQGFKMPTLFYIFERLFPEPPSPLARPWGRVHRRVPT